MGNMVETTACGMAMKYKGRHKVRVCSKDGKTLIFIIESEIDKGKYIELKTNDALWVVWRVLLSVLFQYEPSRG